MSFSPSSPSSSSSHCYKTASLSTSPRQKRHHYNLLRNTMATDGVAAGTTVLKPSELIAQRLEQQQQLQRHQHMHAETSMATQGRSPPPPPPPPSAWSKNNGMMTPSPPPPHSSPTAMNKQGRQPHSPNYYSSAHTYATFLHNDKVFTQKQKQHRNNQAKRRGDPFGFADDEGRGSPAARLMTLSPPSGPLLADADAAADYDDSEGVGVRRLRGSDDDDETSSSSSSYADECMERIGSVSVPSTSFNNSSFAAAAGGGGGGGRGGGGGGSREENANNHIATMNNLRSLEQKRKKKYRREPDLDFSLELSASGRGGASEERDDAQGMRSMFASSTPIAIVRKRMLSTVMPNGMAVPQQSVAASVVEKEVQSPPPLAMFKHTPDEEGGVRTDIHRHHHRNHSAPGNSPSLRESLNISSGSGGGGGGKVKAAAHTTSPQMSPFSIAHRHSQQCATIATIASREEAQRVSFDDDDTRNLDNGDDKENNDDGDVDGDDGDDGGGRGGWLTGGAEDRNRTSNASSLSSSSSPHPHPHHCRQSVATSAKQPHAQLDAIADTLHRRNTLVMVGAARLEAVAAAARLMPPPTSTSLRGANSNDDGDGDDDEASPPLPALSSSSPSPPTSPSASLMKAQRSSLDDGGRGGGGGVGAGVGGEKNLQYMVGGGAGPPPAPPPPPPPSTTLTVPAPSWPLTLSPMSKVKARASAFGVAGAVAATATGTDGGGGRDRVSDEASSPLVAASFSSPSTHHRPAPPPPPPAMAMRGGGGGGAQKRSGHGHGAIRPPPLYMSDVLQGSILGASSKLFTSASSSSGRGGGALFSSSASPTDASLLTLSFDSPPFARPSMVDGSGIGSVGALTTVGRAVAAVGPLAVMREMLRHGYHSFLATHGCLGGDSGDSDADAATRNVCSAGSSFSSLSSLLSYRLALCARLFDPSPSALRYALLLSQGEEVLLGNKVSLRYGGGGGGGGAAAGLFHKNDNLSPPSLPSSLFPPSPFFDLRPSQRWRERAQDVAAFIASTVLESRKRRANANKDEEGDDDGIDGGRTQNQREGNDYLKRLLVAVDDAWCGAEERVRREERRAAMRQRHAEEVRQLEHLIQDKAKQSYYGVITAAAMARDRSAAPTSSPPPSSSAGSAASPVANRVRFNLPTNTSTGPSDLEAASSPLSSSPLVNRSTAAGLVPPRPSVVRGHHAHAVSYTHTDNAAGGMARGGGYSAEEVTAMRAALKEKHWREADAAEVVPPSALRHLLFRGAAASSLQEWVVVFNNTTTSHSVSRNGSLNNTTLRKKTYLEQYREHHRPKPKPPSLQDFISEHERANASRSPPSSPLSPTAGAPRAFSSEANNSSGVSPATVRKASMAGGVGGLKRYMARYVNGQGGRGRKGQGRGRGGEDDEGSNQQSPNDPLSSKTATSFVAFADDEKKAEGDTAGEDVSSSSSPTKALDAPPPLPNGVVRSAKNSSPSPSPSPSSSSPPPASRAPSSPRPPEEEAPPPASHAAATVAAAAAAAPPQHLAELYDLLSRDLTLVIACLGEELLAASAASSSSTHHGNMAVDSPHHGSLKGGGEDDAAAREDRWRKLEDAKSHHKSMLMDSIFPPLKALSPSSSSSSSDECIRSPKSLVLSLSREPLGVDLLVHLLERLSPITSLERLVLHQAGLDTAALVMMGEWALRPNPFAVPPVLSVCGALHTVDLSGNRLKSTDLPLLEAVLFLCPHLRSLSLRNNPLRTSLKDDTFSALESLLFSIGDRLEHLDVGLCGLNDAAVGKLCSYMRDAEASAMMAAEAKVKEAMEREGRHTGGGVRGDHATSSYSSVISSDGLLSPPLGQEHHLLLFSPLSLMQKKETLRAPTSLVPLRRLNIDGATISTATATLLLYTLHTNLHMLEVSLAFVAACNTRSYIGHVAWVLDRNLKAAEASVELELVEAARKLKGGEGHGRREGGGEGDEMAPLPASNKHHHHRSRNLNTPAAAAASSASSHTSFASPIRKGFFGSGPIVGPTGTAAPSAVASSSSSELAKEGSPPLRIVPYRSELFHYTTPAVAGDGDAASPPSTEKEEKETTSPHLRRHSFVFAPSLTAPHPPLQQLRAINDRRRALLTAWVSRDEVAAKRRATLRQTRHSVVAAALSELRLTEKEEEEDEAQQQHGRGGTEIEAHSSPSPQPPQAASLPAATAAEVSLSPSPSKPNAFVSFMSRIKTATKKGSVSGDGQKAGEGARATASSPSQQQVSGDNERNKRNERLFASKRERSSKRIGRRIKVLEGLLDATDNDKKTAVRSGSLSSTTAAWKSPFSQDAEHDTSVTKDDRNSCQGEEGEGEEDVDDEIEDDASDGEDTSGDEKDKEELPLEEEARMLEAVLREAGSHGGGGEGGGGEAMLLRFGGGGGALPRGYTAYTSNTSDPKAFDTQFHYQQHYFERSLFYGGSLVGEPLLAGGGGGGGGGFLLNDGGGRKSLVKALNKLKRFQTIIPTRKRSVVYAEDEASAIASKPRL